MGGCGAEDLPRCFCILDSGGDGAVAFCDLVQSEIPAFSDADDLCAECRCSAGERMAEM